MNCRHCHSPLEHTFLDLGFAPPSNAYLSAAHLTAPEVYYPLKIKVCDTCWLVQTEDYARADELFSPEYAYFSSTSSTWLEHARRYAEKMTAALKLNAGSHVVEVASNDGYLLRNFVKAGIPCLGIEPTESTAKAAQALGIPVCQEFFGEQLARRLVAEGKSADLIAGNNVYAHVPDINDFTTGLRVLLKPEGVVTLEFPHLLKLVELGQFDTVYHEHYSYLSLSAVVRIFAQAGLRVFDVEELPTHGGSLRVFGCREESARATEDTVAKMLALEGERGLRQTSTFTSFQPRADATKDGLLRFLLAAKAAGKRVAAYGAAAKGNTVLNYAGVKPDLLSFVCDAAPAKQNKYLPGSHIPMLPPSALRERRPDIVLILPWNIADEVVKQHGYIAEWGGEFYVAMPEMSRVK
jgi:2-polyprenyl-3-methyl-5-hydroxy-6-metoxy-1,4-benzoquinol methylase